MIQFANTDTAEEVRSMWKEIFNDSEEFMDIYFSQKYKNENTLIYFDNGVAAASLQMLPYKVRFYGQEVDSYYYSGLCTLPQYRNRGYMSDLIKKSFDVMRDRNIPLAILIPAEEWLYKYYNRFNFEETFAKGDKPIKLKEIIKQHKGDLRASFIDFDQEYQQADFCVLKSFNDFKAICAEYVENGMPQKYNLRGMSAVINPFFLLSLYAKKNINYKFIISVHDELTNTNQDFLINNGEVAKIDVRNSTPTFSITLNTLARLLFGFNTSELPKLQQDFFKEHHPIMNLMME